MDPRIPDTLEVLWTYPGGTLVTFSQYNASAPPAGLRDGDIEFRGTKGTLYLQNNGYEVVPDALPQREFPALTPLDRSLSRSYRGERKPVIEAKKMEGKVDSTALHARNFLHCVRSRQACHCDIETGHRSTSTTLIANIAHKTKAYLEWDAKAERFTNNQAANRLLSYGYRAPYRL